MKEPTLRESEPAVVQTRKEDDLKGLALQSRTESDSWSHTKAA